MEATKKLFDHVAPVKFKKQYGQHFLINYPTYVLIPEAIIKCISDKHKLSLEAAERVSENFKYIVSKYGCMSGQCLAVGHLATKNM